MTEELHQCSQQGSSANDYQFQMVPEHGPDECDTKDCFAMKCGSVEDDW